MFCFQETSNPNLPTDCFCFVRTQKLLLVMHRLIQLLHFRLPLVVPLQLVLLRFVLQVCLSCPTPPETLPDT